MEHNKELLLNHINNMAQRRQNVTTVYLSVNTALTGVIAFFFKDGYLSGIAAQVSALMLLLAGIVACDFWRRLIAQYSILIDWWYKQIRVLECSMPEDERVFTKEFHELYEKPISKKRAGLTRHETSLAWLFTVIYIIFITTIVVTMFIRP